MTVIFVRLSFGFVLWCCSCFALAANCLNHIVYQEGSIPVLLTSPHGASSVKRLPGVRERSGLNIPSFINRSDTKTDKITQNVAAQMERWKLAPFVVIAGIHRSQIDFNRPAQWAYEDSKSANCYRQYHRQIRKAVDHIRRRWGQGFLIDIHGQSRFVHDIMRGTRNHQTIRQLLERFGEDVTEQPGGFYHSLRQKGYDVQPNVGAKEAHYSGGFTLKVYGSHQPDGIDALQIELG